MKNSRLYLVGHKVIKLPEEIAEQIYISEERKVLNEISFCDLDQECVKDKVGSEFGSDRRFRSNPPSQPGNYYPDW